MVFLMRPMATSVFSLVDAEVGTVSPDKLARHDTWEVGAVPREIIPLNHVSV